MLVRVLALGVLVGVAPLVRAEEPSPRRAPGDPPRVVVRVMHPDGEPVEGAVVLIGPRAYDDRVPRRIAKGPEPLRTDAAGRVSRQIPAAGLYEAWVSEAPNLDEGWLFRGDCHSVSATFEVGVGDEVLPEIALALPRPGALRVELDRSDLPPPDDFAWGEVSLLRFYPQGWLLHSNDQKKPGVKRLDADGHRMSLAWSGLPAGRYRLMTRGKDRPTNVHDVEVPAGGETAISLSTAPAAEPIEIHYKGPLLERGTRFSVNAYSLEGPQDVGYGLFQGTEATVVTRALRPGRYLVILWDLRLAMTAEVPEATPRAINVYVPEAFSRPTGMRSMRVTVREGLRRTSALPILVAPVEREPLAPGRWFWYSDAQGSPVFPFLQSGAYHVIVPPAGQGAYRVPARPPVARRVDLGAEEDVDLLIDI